MSRAASSSAEPARPGDPDRGATFVELLVVMAVVAILAAVAAPVAETGLRRAREAELRATLRATRDALDRAHDDWRRGALPERAEGISEDGWPETLEVPVKGIPDAEGARRRYLRTLPVNPLAPRGTDWSEGWVLRAHDDAEDAERWGGGDVFDLRPATAGEGLDGTPLAQW